MISAKEVRLATFKGIELLENIVYISEQIKCTVMLGEYEICTVLSFTERELEYIISLGYKVTVSW